MFHFVKNVMLKKLQILGKNVKKTMNKVTWKRKKSNISLSTAPVFSKEDSEEDVDSTEIVDDWRSLVPSKKKAMLEDRIGKSKRLIQEAVQLAEEARYTIII